MKQLRFQLWLKFGYSVDTKQHVTARNEFISWLNKNVGVEGKDWMIGSPGWNTAAWMADETHATLAKLMFPTVIILVIDMLELRRRQFLP